MSRLPQITAKQMIRALETLGFRCMRQKGSHAFFQHTKTGKITVVPIHRGEDLDRSLMHEILRQANVTHDEFVEALKN